MVLVDARMTAVPEKQNNILFLHRPVAFVMSCCMGLSAREHETRSRQVVWEVTWLYRKEYISDLFRSIFHC
jgi:hypothetical protein